MQSGERKSRFKKLKTYGSFCPFLGLSNGTGTTLMQIYSGHKNQKKHRRDLNGNMQSGERKSRPPLIWYLTSRGMEARASSNISQLPESRFDWLMVSSLLTDGFHMTN